MKRIKVSLQYSILTISRLNPPPKSELGYSSRMCFLKTGHWPPWLKAGQFPLSSPSYAKPSKLSGQSGRNFGCFVPKISSCPGFLIVLLRKHY